MREYQPEESDACRCYGGPLFCDHCAGGTYAGPNHSDCGVRTNMHAGCIDCCPCGGCGMHRADTFRRAEVDAWLKEVGATTIHVQDLGAALEAREHGGSAITDATSRMPLYNQRRYRLWQVACMANFARGPARRAAHLARKALGEVGR